MAHLSVALGPRTSATRSMGLTPVFVAWGLALSLAAVAVSAWFIPALIVIWMIVLLARHPADAIIWNAIMLAAWGAASFGFYERATFLPQVLSYGQTAQSPWELLSRFDIWGPRYLVAYPPAWFAVQFELDLDEVWTYFLASVLAVEAAVVHRIWLGTQAPRVPSTAARIGIGIVSGIGFIVLGHFMHGRLAPAHLGMAMILLGLIRWGQRGYPSTSDLFLVGFGLFPLSLMSSGTVIPATMELLCSAWLFAAVDWRARWRTLLWVPLLLLPAVPFMLVGYFKNVKFFEDSEGGFWTVLDHGAGRVFSEGAFVGSRSTSSAAVRLPCCCTSS